MKNLSCQTNFKSLLSQLQYEILPGRFRPGFPGTSKYNHAYAFWKSFWDEVLRENGTTERIDPSEFLGADIIATISKGGEIVGINLHSFLNLEQINVASHPYLHGEHERIFIDGLLKLNCRSAISHGYLTVNKSFRKSLAGISFGPVLGGLGFQVQRALKIDASLGRCRVDLGVDKMMTEAGGIILKKNVMMYNTPTNFCAVLLRDLRPYSDPAICETISTLWNKRVDWTKQTYTKQHDTYLKTP